MTVPITHSPDVSDLIARGAKPRRYGSWYVAEHRIRAMRAYAQTLIATSIGNPLIYLFALGVGLATLVDKGKGVGGSGINQIGDVSYLVFVAPALIGLAAVMVAAEEFTYPMLMGFKWNPIFFGMNAAPITGNQIVAGIYISFMVRMLPTLLLYFVVMLLFGAVPLITGILIVPIALLVAMSIGIVISSYTAGIENDGSQLALIMRFGVTPILLFSGTFFPLTQLPLWLQWIGWISPLWHGTELGRVVSYGMSEPLWLSAVHILYPLALVIVFWRKTQRVVTKRLNK